MPHLPAQRSCRTLGATINEFVLPPNCPIPVHEHAPPHILVMLDGELADVEGATETVCARGSLRYSPGRDRHHVRISSNGAHCLVIEAGGFPDLRFRNRIYVPARDSAGMRESLARWLFTESCASPARVEDCVLALFCHIRDFDRGAPSTSTPWLDDVRRMLDTVGASSTPLADAARIADRSPGLVARTFRAAHAVSIHRYYRRRQVDRAWDMFTSSTNSLGVIANDCGFADQSHMTRTFVRETGETPSRLRARMADGLHRNWFLAAPLEIIGT
ncbi:MAG: AraC family transcriptional regulator [Gemmatimonadota bacterium]